MKTATTPYHCPYGTYKIVAGGSCDHQPPYYSALFWPGSPYPIEAGDLTISPAEPAVTGIDFTLYQSGNIRGTVRDAVTGDPIPGISVQYFSPFTGLAPCTDENGEYTIYDIPLEIPFTVVSPSPVGNPGCANTTPYAFEYWEGKSSSTEATVLTPTVAQRDFNNIDFTLELGGSISGTVHDSDGTSPLPSAQVCVHEFATGNHVACSGVNQDGTYAVSNLAANTFWVVVHAPGYVDNYFDNHLDPGSADAVTITAGSDTPGIDFVMQQAGTIAGQVIAAEGSAPLASIWVCAFDYSAPTFDQGDPWRCDQTEPDGTYEISGIVPGDKRVWLFPEDRLRLFYDGSNTFESATSVTVTGGATTNGINFSLPLAGVIQGMVYAEDGVTPLPGVTISTDSGTYPECSQPDGSYRVFVPAGTHVIKAGSGICSSEVVVPTRYFENAFDPGSATPVTIAVEETVGGIDFALVGPLAAPSDLIATAVSQTQIDLTWSDNSGDETTFHVEHSLNGGADWEELAIVGPGETAYSDDTLTCGTESPYRVRAYRSNDNTFSDYSNVASATTDACTPEIFVVTSANDVSDGTCSPAPGHCSLREAIMAANGHPAADFIEFALPSYPAVITLTSDLPAITEDLIITGPGAAILTIDGADSFRPFAINEGVTAAIDALTVSHGLAMAEDGGGAILNNGTLTVSNSVLANNGGLYGGAISNYGTLTVTASTFSGNSATGTGSKGGGIFNFNYSASLTTIDSIFVDNTASSGGGGVYNYHGAVTVTNSTFSGNSAVTGGGICGGGYGAVLIVTASTFSGNSAGRGGGISIEDTNPTVVTEVTDSMFSGNSASSVGGGMYNTGPGTTTVTTSTFSGNSAPTGGGFYNKGAVDADFPSIGIAIFENNTFVGNWSTILGGGVYSLGTLTVTNSTFSGNSAPNGGNIFNSSAKGALTITSSTVSGSGIESYGPAYVAGTIFDAPCVGILTDNGYNLSDDVSCGFTGVGSFNNAVLNLSPLSAGGPGQQVHTPIALSYAIGAVPNGTVVDNNGVTLACNGTTADQLRAERPINAGGACTSGAVEVPAVTNLVRNGDFSAGEAEWSFWGGLTHSVTSGVLQLTSTGAGSLFQDAGVAAPSGAPFELTVDLGNSSAAAREVQLLLHNPELSDVLSCQFALPSGIGLHTYTLRGNTALAWSDIRVEVVPLTHDGLAALQVDNVSVEYQPSLSVSGVECLVPPMPANLNIARNPDFASGESQWNFFDLVGHAVNAGILTFWDDDTDNGVWQETFFSLPTGAPMNASVQLGNTSSASKEVMLVLHDQDWAGSLMCYFALPANAPLATYSLQGLTTESWDHVNLAVWDLTGNGLAGIQLDNVNVQYQPGLSVSGVQCGIPPMPANLNIARNPDFSHGETSWNAYDMLGHAVNAGVLTFWDDDTSNGMWQDTFYRLPSGAPMNASVQLGNSSSAAKEVMLVLHDQDWSDSLLCYFALPANAPLATYTLQGPTSSAWDHVNLAVWDLTGNGLAGIQLDNVNVQYQPGLSVSGVQCGIPPMPANLNIARNPDFSQWGDLLECLRHAGTCG